MQKRAVDLSFDELSRAGIAAGVAAFDESCKAGLVTLKKDPRTGLVETHPDGRTVPRIREELESELLPKADLVPKGTKRSSAA
jgi:hypothetical protein